MTLEKKINLMLAGVTTVVLAVAFSIIVGVEATTIKQQVMSDSRAIIDIMRGDIGRMFSQVHEQQGRLQVVVDGLSKTPGVKHINVVSVDEYYLANTDHTLVGGKPDEDSLKLIEQAITGGSVVDTTKDQGLFLELERRTPVRLVFNNKDSHIIGVIEVKVATDTKSAGSISSAQKIIQAVSLEVEQNIRPTMVARNKNLAEMQNVANQLIPFRYYQDFIVFDDNLNVVARMGEKNNATDGDSDEYKQLRKDVLTGKKQDTSVERAYEGGRILVRVVPVRFTVSSSTESAGLLEVRILTSAYQDKINMLKLRMFGIGVILVAVLVFVLSRILRRQVVEPIVRYSKIAQRVSDGDLYQTIEHTSNDEIGRFGEVFNSMVSNLREIDQMKSDFISVAAHQLRTPLAGVKWVLKLVLDGDIGSVTEEQRGMIKRGYDTNEKMIQLVNSLLNVSRIENEHVGYNIEKNDFAKLLKALTENSELAARERKIEVHVENNAGTIPPFFFDAEKLLIALQNLVDNAVKYTLPGGQVTIVIDRKEDFLQIKVTDTGVGVPKAELPKLFSKFFRASNVINLQTDGSGLGLFIVKSIIIRHGGQIWVDSTEGKGTIMTVVIPLITELVPKNEVLYGSDK